MSTQFQKIVDEQLTQATTGFQWGGQYAPIQPALFQKNLMDEADSMNIDWPDAESASDEKQTADQAVIKYSIFYQGLVNRAKTQPAPMNAPQPFMDWWNAQAAS